MAMDLFNMFKHKKKPGELNISFAHCINQHTIQHIFNEADEFFAILNATHGDFSIACINLPLLEHVRLSAKRPTLQMHDIVNLPLEQFLLQFSLVLPQEAEQIIGRYRSCASTKKSIKYEERIGLPNNSLLITSNTLVPVVENNECTYVIYRAREISKQLNTEAELKLNEQRLAHALEATNDGMWEYSPLTGQVYWSPRYYAMLGYKNQEIEASLENWKKLLHEEDLYEAEHKLSKVIEKQTEVYEHIARFYTKEKELKWMLIRGKVTNTANGKVACMIGTHTDITERKNFESQLIKAKEKAEEGDRLKTAFLANLSHEIRTPMNGIMGFAQMLLSKDIEYDKANKYANIILDSSQRLLDTVNDIVQISKLE
ncbi:MAG: PAS domain-containing protein, partial [Bacteroidales bacterium]|nr:PAS domain-containing protein [Bacteroidales bacterium]